MSAGMVEPGLCFIGIKAAFGVHLCGDVSWNDSANECVVPVGATSVPGVRRVRRWSSIVRMTAKGVRIMKSMKQIAPDNEGSFAIMLFDIADARFWSIVVLNFAILPTFAVYFFASTWSRKGVAMLTSERYDTPCDRHTWHCRVILKHQHQGINRKH